MRIILLPLGLCIALGACGGGDVSLTNATADEVAASAKAAGTSARLTAGEWQTDIDVTSVDIPGLPAAVRDQMVKTMKKQTSHKYCMTEAEAERPGGLFTDGNKDCTYERFEMRDGEIDSMMICPGPKGSNTSLRLAVKGRFSADAVYASQELKIEGGPQTIEIKGKLDSRRIGDCPK